MADQYYLDPITGKYQIKPKPSVQSQPNLTMGAGVSNPYYGLGQGQTYNMGQQTTDPITGKIITVPNTINNPPPVAKSQTATAPTPQAYIPPAKTAPTTQTTQPITQTAQQPMGAFNFSMLMDAIGQKTQQNNELVKQRQLAIKQYFGGNLTPEEINSLSPELQKALQSGDRNNIEMSIRVLGDELSGQKTSLPQTLQYLTQGYQTELQNIEDKKKTMETALKDYATLSQDPTLFKNYLETTYGDYLKGTGLDVNSILGGGNINVYGIKSSPLTQGFGGTDSGVTASDGGTFLSSLGEEGNKQIAQQLLTSNVYANLTVDQALKKWSNSGYGAEVAQGIDPQAFIRDLPQDQLDAVLAGIKQREGVSQQPSTDYIYQDALKGISSQGLKAFSSMTDIQKSNVSALLNGDIDISTLMQSRGLSGSKVRQQLLQDVKSVDPTYTENRYKVKQQWDNPNGKAFLTRSSINTAMSHMATTYETALALGNTKIPKYNDIANWASKNVGNPELTSFVYDLTALSGEIASAYKNGTAPSELDTERFFDAMSGSMSPTQFKGVFTQSSKLMAGKLKSLAQEYKQAIGKYPTDPIIQPSILDELKNVGIDTSFIDKLLEEQGYGVSGGEMSDLRSKYNY